MHGMSGGTLKLASRSLEIPPCVLYAILSKMLYIVE